MSMPLASSVVKMVILLSYVAMFFTTATAIKNKNEHTSKEIADNQEELYGVKLPREPRDGFYDYLDKCTDILTEKCGRDMLNHEFIHGKLSDSCCCKLKKKGDLCNKALTWTLAHIKQFKSKAALIYKKGAEVFIECLERCPDESKEGKKDDKKDGKKDGKKDEKKDEKKDGKKDEKKDEKKDGKKDGKKDEKKDEKKDGKKDEKKDAKKDEKEDEEKDEKKKK